MTRSTNYSELRKMSNPIPINTWQMRSQKKIDDSAQYDPGIMDQCINNSISPHSTYSVSPSPSQSLSSFKELNRQQHNLLQQHQQYSVQQAQQQQQQPTPIDQYLQLNQLINENSCQSTNNLDAQSELESLFINATLSDATLSSSNIHNDDNSNTSSNNTKIVDNLRNDLNNNIDDTDDLCDIEMGGFQPQDNLNISTNEDIKNIDNNDCNKTFLLFNKIIKQEDDKTSDYLNQTRFIDLDNCSSYYDDKSIKPDPSSFFNNSLLTANQQRLHQHDASTARSTTTNSGLNINSNTIINNNNNNNKHESTTSSSSCDPVLTQIALNTTGQINNKNINLINNNNTNNNNSNNNNNNTNNNNNNNNNNNINNNNNANNGNINNYNLNKRHLSNSSLNTNITNNTNVNKSNNSNNDDIYLPSINVSNLTTQNNTNYNYSDNPIITSSASSHIRNITNTSNQQPFTRSSNLTTGTITTPTLAVNISKISPNTATNIFQPLGTYSMSLPSNYTNYMEYAASNPSSSSSTQHQQQQLHTSIQQHTQTQPIFQTQLQIQQPIEIGNNCELDESLISSSNTQQTTDNRDGDKISHLTNYESISSLSTSLPSYNMDEYMNKLRPQHYQLLQQPSLRHHHIHRSHCFNSSNRIVNSPHLNKLLLSNNKVLNSFNSDSNLSCTNTAVSSIASPLHDEFDNNGSGTIVGSGSVNDDDYDEQDSDDDSLNNETLFDIMNKSRDTYFWQYNIQSKGPKTKKVLTLRNKDPHLHRDFFDPVYQLQTISSRGTSLNKLRKGDGNDVTPNSDKLYNLGIQIRDFIQKSYQMSSNNSGSNAEIVNNEKANLKREKNKIASRACRLKKKAQHEANKLKLNGLNQEHKQLVETIVMAKDLIKKRLTAPNELPTDKSLTEQIEEICNQSLTVKVAGNTDNYIHMLMQQIEKERCKNLFSQTPNLIDNSANETNDDLLASAMMIMDTNNEKTNSD